MKTWVVAALVALVLAAVPTAAVVLTRDDASASRSAGAEDSASPTFRGYWTRTDGSTRAERKAEHAERKAEHAERKAERRERKAERRQDRSERVGPDRADEMARRAQEHADGMKAWAACVKEAGDDPAKRVDCVKPLPPGLAKNR